MFLNSEKTRDRSKPIKNIDNFDKCVVRKLVCKFQIQKHQHNFKGSKTTINTISETLVLSGEKPKTTAKF